MRNIILIIAVTLVSGKSFALTFKKAVEYIGDHHKSRSLGAKHLASIEEAKGAGSWGDPTFKFGMKNYPKDTLKKDQSPMTSMEFMVAQKIPLTTKYGNIEDSKMMVARSISEDRKQYERELVTQLWYISIGKRKKEEQRAILGANLAWIDKMLKVSKKLYANGKISQQALFELNIRRSEIESKIEKVKFSLTELDDKSTFLTGKRGEYIQTTTVPWKLLVKESKVGGSDYREKSLRSIKSSRELMSRATTQSLVPDVTFSFSYNKRANIDGNGDFVGASVSFPLPFSGNKYASRRSAVEKQRVASSELKNYLSFKESELSSLKTGEKRIKSELSILSNKSIGFARNSRNISSRSYGHGKVGYLELLNSELKLQELLLKKTELKSELAINRVNQKLLRGDKLHEN